jgi:hypothetical protein
MGDRSNIVVRYGDERVYLYGHWMGAASIEHAAHGLRSDRAIGDPPYLARIIFSSMTRGDPDGETGYGIWSSLVDNDNPVLVIDADSGSVWFEDPDGLRVTSVFPRDEFLRMADQVPPLEPFWSEEPGPWPFAPFFAASGPEPPR